MADPVQAEAASGLPQLDFSTWPSQILWLAVTLTALYYVFTRIALPRIEETLDERAATIDRDLTSAADLNRRADEAQKAYEDALAAARAEARRVSDEAKAETEAQLKSALAEADARIAADLAESEARLAAIRTEAAEQARVVAQAAAEAMIERFSPAPLPADRVEQAVRDAVSARMAR